MKIYDLLNKIPTHIKVAMSAWISRIGIAIIQIFTIRTLISYLGEEKYAVYVILYSLLAWCNLAECGIGSSLQNYISESRAKNKDYSVYLKTSLQIIMILFIIFLLLLILCANPLQNFLLEKYLYLNEIKTINIVLIVSCIFIILTFINISIKILYAIQKGIIPNILQLLSYIISAISIIFLNRYSNNNSSILLALLCFCVPQLSVMIIPFIKIFKTSFKKIFIVDKEVLKQFTIRAIKFGGFAVMAACVLQVEYIVMAKTLDANSITTYNVFSKLFLFIIFIYSSLLTAFWPVSNELFNTGQYLKLRNLLFKYSVLGILLMIVGILGVYLFKDYVLKILAPNLNITVGILFFILFIIYYIMRVISDTYAMFLQSVNSLKIFWIFTPIQAVISIFAQYFLSIKYGIYGIILGLIISFVIASSFVYPYKAYSVLKNINKVTAKRK